MEVNDVLESDDLADGLILVCQARPVSESVEVSYD
jgi:3-ketosteroid 9alpha-monooxygenase subunit B